MRARKANHEQVMRRVPACLRDRDHPCAARGGLNGEGGGGAGGRLLLVEDLLLILLWCHFPPALGLLEPSQSQPEAHSQSQQGPIWQRLHLQRA